jgi:hypothetical protein
MVNFHSGPGRKYAHNAARIEKLPNLIMALSFKGALPGPSGNLRTPVSGPPAAQNGSHAGNKLPGGNVLNG